MLAQTIALFRYQLPGILNARTLVLVVVVYGIAFLSSRFVAELAIINSEKIALASLADLLRYSLVLLLIINFCHQVTQDYELSQFERLLSMPISRFQYVSAQLLVLTVSALLLVIPALMLMSWLGGFSIAFYWSASLFLELWLVGHFALLAAISLEKLPIAVVFAIVIYLLSKIAPLIELILSQSSPIYEGEHSFQLAQLVFGWIQYVLPGNQAFAQNNLVLSGAQFVKPLLNQFLAVFMYGLFIQFVVLVDFYRKEFNQT
jgi:hypothetical protein